MKTTITLEGEKKIREMLEQALMLESVKDYADTMAGFYWQKAMDVLSAMSETYEKAQEEAHMRIYRQYHESIMQQPSDCYIVKTALEYYNKARNFVNDFDWHVSRMVKDLAENPITVECADGDDPQDVADAWLEIDTKVWERFTYDIARLIGDLREDSAGHISQLHEEEYLDIFHLHLD